MGILEGGIIGKVRNKTGPSIARRHRNLNVVTAIYRNSNAAPTEKQEAQQSKFGMLNSFLSRIDRLVNTGFKKYTKGNSPVNAAYSYNFDHAFVLDGDNYRLNYPKIVYSRGHIETPADMQIAAEAGSITFSWLPQPQSAYCQFTDLASFLVYNPVKDSARIFIGVVDRYAQGYIIESLADYAGDTVHCYVNFTSANGKLTGDSLYVGEIVCM